MSPPIDSPPKPADAAATSSDRLEWRIPHARTARTPFLFDRRFWLGLLIWGVGLALIWTFDDPLRLIAAFLWAVLGFVAWAFVRYRDRSRIDDQPHFAIDAAGLHWRDSAGQTHLFPVERVRTFRLGLDEDTERPVAALTLQLVDGQETQPIELASPVGVGAVRAFATNRWQVDERKDDGGERYAGYLRTRLRELPQTPTVRRLARWALPEPWHESGEWLLADLPGRGKLFFDDSSGDWIWEDFRESSLRHPDLDDVVSRLAESNDESRPAPSADVATRLRAVDLPPSLAEAPRRERFLAWFAEQWDDELPGDASDLTLRVESDGPGRFLLDGEWHGAENWFFQGTYECDGQTDSGTLTVSRFADLERSQQAFQRAAKTLGMLVQFQTGEGRWSFIGSRDAFEEWTDWIASHAAAMKPREPGIRLPTFVWGSEPIRVSIQYSPIPYVEDGRLAGPEEFFDQLVENLRTMLATWPVGKEAQVQLFPRRDPPFVLSFRERRIDVFDDDDLSAPSREP